jgi:hypothetical protein
MPPKILPASWVRNPEGRSCRNSLDVSLLELLLCLRHACKLRCRFLFLSWRNNLSWQLTTETFSLFHNSYRIVFAPNYVRSSVSSLFRPIFYNFILAGLSEKIYLTWNCFDFDCDNYYLKFSQIKSNPARCYLLLFFFLRLAAIFFPILTKPEFSRQVLVEVPNVKVHQNPFSGIRRTTEGQTEIHDETKCYFSQIYESS